MSPVAIDELLRLPKRRRMEIAERLWLSAADEKSAPVPVAHRKVVNARLAAYEAGEAKTISHAELMRRLKAG